MKRKILIFFAWLIVLTTVLIILRSILSENNTLASGFIFGGIKLLIPFIAVLLTEKGRIPYSEYGLTSKKIPYKSLFKILITVSLIFPLFILCVTLLFGNILNIELFGELLTKQFSSITLFNTNLSTSYFVAILLAYLTSLLASISYNFLFAISGEIAWRGLLEKELEVRNRGLKTAVIGLIWGLWMVIPGVINRVTATSIDFYYIIGIISNLAFFITCSFVCINALRRTNSLIASTLIVSITTSFSHFYYLLDHTNQYFSFIGSNHGLLAIIALILINYIITKGFFDKSNKLLKN